MTTPTFDISKVLNAILPREYDGKSAQEGLVFASSAKVYYATATTAGLASQLAWLVILQHLTGDAASWAGPHIIRAATAIVWTNENAFEADFKAHFWASNDKEAAITELTKLCKASHKLGTVKEYTAQFNAVAARTSFSDDDKRERYRQGLPYCIKDEFVTTAHDISDLAKTQKVALLMDQQLAQHAEEKPRNFSFWKRGEKVAATMDDKPFTGTCWNCSKRGHKSEDCRSTRGKPQQAAASTSSASNKLVALQVQLKAVQECVATLTLAQEKEGF